MKLYILFRSKIKKHKFQIVSYWGQIIIYFVNFIVSDNIILYNYSER